MRKGTAHVTAWMLLLSMDWTANLALRLQTTDHRANRRHALDAHEVPPGSLTLMDVYCAYRQTTSPGAAEMRLATAEHSWSSKRVVGDLAELPAGQAILPSYDRPVFFRSIGLGLEDIAIAHALYELAGPRGEAHTGWTTERER